LLGLVATRSTNTGRRSHVDTIVSRATQTSGLDSPRSPKKAERVNPAEHGPVSAEEWFSGGERLPYDPERASFDDGSPLRVFVRHASGAGTTLTFLPGWPDGSFGWAKVDAELAERSDPDRLFLDYVGHGDSDKPREYPYSTYERADLVEALWRARSVEATVVIAFDYSCIVTLELLARRIERQRAGEDPGTVISACLLANGGLFADGHTHPWFTTPLMKSRIGGPLMWVGQHSRRGFAPIFRSVFSRSYRVTAAEIEQAHQAISRRDGVRVLPETAAYVDEHVERAARWDLARIAAEFGGAVHIHVLGSSEDRFEARQLHLARERLGDAVESTELPGGHLATAEQPGRLVELIEALH
jgi:pimeloyl-ACP methyl ester carboxylesterase